MGCTYLFLSWFEGPGGKNIFGFYGKNHWMCLCSRICSRPIKANGPKRGIPLKWVAQVDFHLCPQMLSHTLQLLPFALFWGGGLSGLPERNVPSRVGRESLVTKAARCLRGYPRSRNVNRGLINPWWINRGVSPFSGDADHFWREHSP